MTDHPPASHKELAKFLKARFDDVASVTIYRDNSGNRPVPIGTFGEGFHSTIGSFDRLLALPEGNFELAGLGNYDWLANSLASSIYWMTERRCDAWPLVCEDVIRDNATSRYRHMAFMPSAFGHTLSSRQRIQWLLGVPVTDNDISLPGEEILQRATCIYPNWLLDSE